MDNNKMKQKREGREKCRGWGKNQPTRGLLEALASELCLGIRKKLCYLGCRAPDKSAVKRNVNKRYGGDVSM